jgi:hypothetical protein
MQRGQEDNVIKAIDGDDIFVQDDKAYRRNDISSGAQYYPHCFSTDHNKFFHEGEVMSVVAGCGVLGNDGDEMVKAKREGIGEKREEYILKGSEQKRAKE